MSRVLHLSNGKLGVRTNQFGLVDEVYFPHVGLERQTRGAAHRIGVHVDGRTSWLSDADWTHKAFYNHGSFAGQRTIVNRNLGLMVELEDVVQPDEALLIRNMHIINTRSDQRAITVFFHQAFQIGREIGTDAAFYVAERSAIVHAAAARAFAVSGMTDVGQWFDQHSVGRFGDGLEGTWRDAEDGELAGANYDRGTTDSVMRFSLMIGGLSSRRVHYWLAASESIEKALLLSDAVSHEGVHQHVELATRQRRKWLSPAFKVLEQLPAKHRRSFLESLVSLGAAIDHDGAIVSLSAASTPAFCSPRVGAYAAWPLARLGYQREVSNFLAFCRRSMAKDGFWLSQYGADGSILPPRHPYRDGRPPLQSDQTATVLFVFSQVLALDIVRDLLENYYESLVKSAADFLASSVDEVGLPRASYDFADAKREVSTYTTGATYAALLAAAELAEMAGDQTSSVKWRMAAEDMRQAFREQLLDEREVIPHATKDNSASIAALFGAFMFGLVDLDDPIMVRTAEDVERKFWRDDGLFGADDEADFVGSLWMAQYYMEADRVADAWRILDAVRDALAAGDVGGSTQATWAHAEYVNTLLDTLTRA